MRPRSRFLSFNIEFTGTLLIRKATTHGRDIFSIQIHQSTVETLSNLFTQNVERSSGSLSWRVAPARKKPQVPLQ